VPIIREIIFGVAKTREMQEQAEATFELYASWTSLEEQRIYYRSERIPEVPNMEIHTWGFITRVQLWDETQNRSVLDTVGETVKRVFVDFQLVDPSKIENFELNRYPNGSGSYAIKFSGRLARVEHIRETKSVVVEGVIG